MQWPAISRSLVPVALAMALASLAFTQTPSAHIVLVDQHLPPQPAAPPISDANCPQGEVVWSAGERVKELVQDLAQFDAIEHVRHAELDSKGNLKKEVDVRFDYVVSISEPSPGELQITEFRAPPPGSDEPPEFPGGIATKGLPALALVFHPDNRDDFAWNCEGKTVWNGAPAWVVSFAQREDKPHLMSGFLINGTYYPLSTKGRAWVDADTYQILHIESDLAKPVPEIQLFKQHWVADYAPVKFAKSKVELWLPKTAELTFDFRGHHYYRRHTYDRFQLFAVDAEEKRSEPKSPAQSGGEPH